MREALDPIALAAQFINLTSRHIFLTGKAGTGKTTFLRNLISLTPKKAVIVAPTGIAAINAAGVTIHSLFQLPFGAFLPKEMADHTTQQHFHTPRSIVRHLNMNAARRRILLDLELLIIDEVSMLRADLLDAIDLILRYVRKNNSSSFGGVQLLLIGDLHQLPPVVKKEEWAMLSTCYKSAFFFDALALEKNPPIYIELEKIYRQADETFIALLNNLRSNQVTESDMALLRNYYRENYQPEPSAHYITLTTHNHKADALNRDSLALLEGHTFTYKATVEDEFPESAFPVEENLVLKVGAQVMFVKNDPTGDQRFFNGKIATVTALANDSITVRLDGTQQKLVVDKYTWKNIRYRSNPSTNEIEEEVIGTFLQFPLKLAWAITVHKSQGLTFDRAIIDIGSAFAPGQIYVALSRLRSLNGLILTSLISDRGIRQDQHVAFFAKKKNEQEDLSVQVAREKDIFLKHSLMQSFNFTLLDREVYEHVFSYTKDERKSVKQTHLQWAVTFQQDVMALKANADKFIKQMERLFVNPGPSGLDQLLERTQAAEHYFGPRLEELSERIFSHIEIVKAQKQTKEYLSELISLEAMCYEQFQKIRKARALLESTINNTPLTKQDVQALHQGERRREQLNKVFASSHREEVDPSESSFGRTRSLPKKKTTKEPKIDTKEITFSLFKEGKSIPEIAKARKITQSTIEAHLAHFVAKNELKASTLIPLQKLNDILAAIRSLKSIRLNELREHLGRSYAFGEIKIAVAAYLAEGND